MSTESEGFDPYAVVLADLRAKRDQIDQAIQALEGLRLGPRGMVAPTTPAQPSNVPQAGEFLGMSIAEAAKKLLANRKQAMGNGDIAAGLTAGGLVMSENTGDRILLAKQLTHRSVVMVACRSPKLCSLGSNPGFGANRLY